MRRFLMLSATIMLFIGCSKESGTSNKLNVVETKAQLIFPEKNSECTAGRILSLTESEVTFRWSKIESAERYRVYVTNISNASTNIFETTETSFNITLLRGTPYKWYVGSILKNSQEQVDSDTEAFYNASASGEFAYVPFPALIIAPENGALMTAATNAMTLQWEASDLDGDILNYDVYFGTEAPPNLYAEEVLSTQLEVSEVIPDNTYYWQIVTRDAQGNESISEVFTFEVIE